MSRPDSVYRLALWGVPAFFLFRHHLPFGNVGFAVLPVDAVTVGDMTTTEHPTDPLAASFAVLLRGPLTELYALLWRVGVLEVRTNERRPRQLAEYSRATG
ncbi:Rv1535 domain-containing protein [Mycobacterium sp. Z3061]|uniref:Rv1535 domain-containing protein n=1 Tax=Mycobacterium sp. Z3061 TaxID=3073562 RepID=UPI0028733FBD|nr:Rv1535 domain-containing protein [Mycobacterium sp. Z3061]